MKVELTQDDAERLGSIASLIELHFENPNVKRDVDYLRKLTTRIDSETSKPNA